MTCDLCARPMNYCFYINDEHWFKAVGRREEHVCAHCILEKLGGLEWYIVWNEQAQRIRDNIAQTEKESVKYFAEKGTEGVQGWYEASAGIFRCANCGGRLQATEYNRGWKIERHRLYDCQKISNKGGKDESLSVG